MRVVRTGVGMGAASGVTVRHVEVSSADALLSGLQPVRLLSSRRLGLRLLAQKAVLRRRDAFAVNANAKAPAASLFGEPPARTLGQQLELTVNDAAVRALQVGYPCGAQPKRSSRGCRAQRERAASPPRYLSQTASA